MKAEDLGIDVKTGAHDPVMTEIERRFIRIMKDHVGEKNALCADVLAVMMQLGIGEDGARGIASDPNNAREVAGWKRNARYIHNHLLQYHEHCPILSRPGYNGGYWLAENEAEAERFYASFRRRGLTGLVKATRGKKAAIVDVVQQLSFEFDDIEKNGARGMIARRADLPTPVEIVDAFLERMTRNPEKFADGIRYLREKHAGIFVPKGRIAAIQQKIAQLNDLARF